MTELISIVIAEDDPKIAEIQRRFIDKIEGFDVVGIAHDLDDARDLLDVFRPQLLLLDNQFPKGTGLELLRELRAKSAHTDVILVTAAKEVETLRTAMHNGIFDYILKPVVFERLKTSLNQYSTHVQKLANMDSLIQSQVDGLLASGVKEKSEPYSPRLPKGIDAITLNKIREVLNAPTIALNAEQVGQQIGASRTTARRYLEYMVGRDELCAEVAYGSVGRPERRYHKP
ncbi:MULTISPECIES: response regulator [unclassified Salinivibrio]|uniref:response regulator n=1 Tax=unclassified Salinivibrio TaxID=2636825 RepID=UPI00092A830E|nr:MULTISPECIES: response regulator [unclassified Salinivibrio]OOE67169.1 two-component system response regulator [Salinivibrio sp. IB868]OOE76948.1 two-component system response regulator [Salinivibrio sp. ML290]OOE77280.1 two-component system response regulator [Salinivibrio sp. IB870]OOE81662.1 two-component system response regulator [Salinivibrio sp. ML198]OOF11327.1 two-component system response regulator [Salinivibrio sp. PR5]